MEKIDSLAVGGTSEVKFDSFLFDLLFSCSVLLRYVARLFDSVYEFEFTKGTCADRLFSWMQQQQHKRFLMGKQILELSP